MASQMDINKDGFVCVEDLQTCLRNVNTEHFYKEGGKAVSKSQFNTKDKFFTASLPGNINLERIIMVCKQIF